MIRTDSVEQVTISVDSSSPQYAHLLREAADEIDRRKGGDSYLQDISLGEDSENVLCWVTLYFYTPPWKR